MKRKRKYSLNPSPNDFLSIDGSSTLCQWQFPLNAIQCWIFNTFIRWFLDIPQTMRTILDHTEKKNVAWTALMLPTYLQFMKIPCFNPLIWVSLDLMKKEVVQYPNVYDIGDWVCGEFQGQRRFLGKAMGDVVPGRSILILWKLLRCLLIILKSTPVETLLTFPRYKTLFQDHNDPPLTEKPTNSQSHDYHACSFVSLLSWERFVEQSLLNCCCRSNSQW